MAGQISKELSKRTWNASQSWYHERLFMLLNRKVRCQIRRNAYDEQSYARAELFDGDKWNEIAHLNIQFWPQSLQTLSYVRTDVRDENFDGLVKLLMLEVQKIME